VAQRGLVAMATTIVVEMVQPAENLMTVGHRAPPSRQRERGRNPVTPHQVASDGRPWWLSMGDPEWLNFPETRWLNIVGR